MSTNAKITIIGDKLNSIDKQFNEKLKLMEGTVNVSLKNMKEGLNLTIKSFDQQIKDVISENNATNGITIFRNNLALCIEILLFDVDVNL